MAFGRPKATASDSDAPLTFDGVRGFDLLPQKERILAASIYAGVKQALREDREEAELDRLRHKFDGMTSLDL